MSSGRGHARAVGLQIEFVVKLVLRTLATLMA